MQSTSAIPMMLRQQLGPQASSPLSRETQRSPYVSRVSSVIDPRQTRLRPARQVPSWAWTLLAYSLSITPTPNRRRLCVGTLLYVLTLVACLTLAATSAFFTVYDIISSATHSTVFTGTADLILGVAWLSLGTYANWLAHKVLTSPELAASIQLHTRRFLRINTGLLMLLAALAGVAVHMYAYAPEYSAARCTLVALHPAVCRIRYFAGCVYAALVVYWNLIVAWCVLSICRTHTVACRRLVRELEFEGTVLEKAYALRLGQRARDLASGDAGEVAWASQETLPPLSSFMQDVEGSDADDERPGPAAEEGPGANVTLQIEDAPTLPPPPPTTTTMTRANGAREEEGRDVSLPSLFRRMEEAGVQRPEEFERLAFTAEDVCMRYWHIGCRLRISSLVFQRWFATWLVFVAVWALSYIVFWLNHRAFFLDLAHFFIPVLLIALLCSAYAEVNLECARILESLCPRPDRIYVNRYFTSQPVVMTVYTMPLNYQVIAGFIVAFAIAFTSRIVMDEMDKS